MTARSQDCAIDNFFRRGQRIYITKLSWYYPSIAKSRFGDGFHDFGKVAGQQPDMFCIYIFRHKQMTVLNFSSVRDLGKNNKGDICHIPAV